MSELVTFGETMAVFSPKTNGPLRYVSDYRLRIAGAESNTAVGLQKLGHSTEWISSLGDDELGHFILNSVRAEGVNTADVHFDTQHRSGLMLKQISGIGETSVSYYRENSAFSFFSANSLNENAIRASRILHLTGITPVLSESCRQAIFAAAEIARAQGVQISFDPNIRQKLWKGIDYVPMLKSLAEQADILLIGLNEAEALYGTKEPQQICSAVFKSGRTHFIAIKDGGNGAWAATSDVLCKIEPYPCHPIDPIGAGDAFNAAFLAGVLENQPILQCGKMGAAAGALATQTDGDVEGQPCIEQLRMLLTQEEQIYR
ncbi:MAG: sugar kinase [Oscillospiraceae bacterium]